ncbi:MAG: Putative 4-hydroxy-4-methyl-2-oxoglutarate aldolase [Acidimicrobiales bacterium AG-410-I20]|nr:MAG: Putative 4-hydroxy-4-methyl-2-oxoglutarate aldolase [Acidimicrobiales bacterium AG-410-I20]
MTPTADLCDKYGEAIKVIPGPFISYGGKQTINGEAVTIDLEDDNSLVREALEGEGKGRVLVVAGKGSIRCALVGGNLGSLASQNGWGGIVIDGCVRDAEELSTCQIGIYARGTCPRRSEKQGKGSRNVSVEISDVTISPGMKIWADADGVVVADQNIDS